ncbi:alpha/beta hydrolase [Sphingopyxis sp. JAI128]|uniref:alpha/beta hydrolase n=1 Tax=Sphingopyxis sp. JAI128 TaxID=2723066 RepID=UPI001847E423|nr:alpha/beta hydrolase [Sphingopyxis sp. JAI128]MBB6425054.1 acetyl esterase [Sphingopyxis sp. JAI128]
MPKGLDTMQNDMADPDIRRFVDAINAAYAEHGAPAGTSMAARRAVAERVRKPWREGGPIMAETRELDMGGVRLRLHRPVGDAKLPVMLYIHGGGWTLFSIDTHDRLMREYAARAGIAVLGIDYSLSPENKFPVALEECAGALDWIAAQADALGLDAGRVLIGGDSAGANLSVATCLLQRQHGRPLPIAMLLNYGAFAPEHAPSYTRFGAGDYPLEADEMDIFWANYIDTPDQLADPLVAPLRADLSGMPPAFLAIADCDILADCNDAFARKLEEAGVPTRAVTYQGATHSFLEAVSIAPLASRALDEQAAWICDIVGT